MQNTEWSKMKSEEVEFISPLPPPPLFFFGGGVERVQCLLDLLITNKIPAAGCETSELIGEDWHCSTKCMSTAMVFISG